jgi:hypothetical protein
MTTEWIFWENNYLAMANSVTSSLTVTLSPWVNLDYILWSLGKGEWMCYIGSLGITATYKIFGIFIYDFIKPKAY